jgi:soluble lytic murein transglycosylase-like protein
MRLRSRIALFAIWLLASFGAGGLRAEYVVLRNGQRLQVTGYQLLGDRYRLQMKGGFVEVAAAEVVTIEPEEVFTPIAAPVNPARLAANPEFAELIQAAANRYKVDADLISSVIAIESNYNPKAISRKNARGLMQLIPGTATRFGVRNVFDPRENINAGTQYLGELLHRYDNDLIRALAAYNAGPQNVQKYGRVPPFRETQTYVQRVKRNYSQRKVPVVPTPTLDPNVLFGPAPATNTPSPPKAATGNSPS